MAEIVFASSEVVTAAKMSRLADQLITIATSSTRPPTPVDAQHMFETDTRRTLRWSTGADRWVSRDAAVRLRHAHAVAIEADSFETLPMEVEDSDIYGMAENALARITIPDGYAGLWIFGGAIDWEADATGSARGLSIVRGSETVASITQPPCSTAGYSRQTVAALIMADVGDDIELRGFQDSGSTLNMLTASNSGGGEFDPIFWGHFIDSGLF